jgi:hypothetical protein
MEAALRVESRHTPRRGEDLLLLHCLLVGRDEEEQPPARSRLDAKLGPELAELLVRALTPRAQGRRGSSSP